MENFKDKPLADWTLSECKQYCSERLSEQAASSKKGRKDVCCEDFGGDCLLCKALICTCDCEPDDWKLEESYPRKQLTELEFAICKTIGARFVSYDGMTSLVSLWRDAPRRYENSDGTLFRAPDGAPSRIGALDKSLFPSVAPNTCCEVILDENLKEDL